MTSWRVEQSASSQQFHVGRGAIGVVVPALTGHLRSVAVVTSPHAAQTRAWGTLLSALEKVPEIQHFRSAPHSPVELTEAATAELRSRPPDAIVVMGGGAASDMAKGIALLLAEGGRFRDHCSVFTPPDSLVSPPLLSGKLPIIAIASTLSGAEVTPGAGGEFDGRKIGVWDEKLRAAHVLLDFDVYDEVGWSVLAASAFNALAHDAEALYSRTATPISDALATNSAERLARGLARAEGDPDDDAWSEILVGGAMAGIVMSQARPAIHHALCHSIAMIGRVSHGEANAVMLPHALRFNLAATRHAQKQFYDALARGIDVPTGGPDCLVRLQDLTGVRTSLRDLGLGQNVLPPIADATMHDRGLYFNPVKVDRAEQLYEVLDHAWHGDRYIEGAS